MISRTRKSSSARLMETLESRLLMSGDAVGDTIRTATDLYLNPAVNGNVTTGYLSAIETSGDKDVFALHIQGTGRAQWGMVKIDVDSLSSEIGWQYSTPFTPKLTITDANGQTYTSNSNNTIDPVKGLAMLKLAAGTDIYIHISSFMFNSLSTPTGSYKLGIIGKFDQVGGNEATAQYLPLRSNGTMPDVDGSVDYKGDVDVYRVHPTLAGALAVMVSGPNSKLTPQITVTQGGVTLTPAFKMGNAYYFSVKAGADYYINVSGANNTVGDYRLSVQLYDGLDVSKKK